ncbi:hypothetical protein [Bartonella sp. AR 15-3]|uniref:hypothetical protein n=1 Tax=Bartonella sp. AR 15-3 TaxID=545617 RepID=UPI0001F4CABA|nr:hypothetical protein [Bartonella sp. AR 15-3]OPB31298.1 hypothetical protein BAR153v2_002400 [Bartonella sp. AR 15-3]CBI79666.1 hypothetical protein BAR15_160010 [Bartonella sp. AR 15-3]
MARIQYKLEKEKQLDGDHGGRETKVDQFMIAFCEASIQPYQKGGFDGENTELCHGNNSFLGSN